MTVGQLKKVDNVARILFLADGTTLPLDNVLELQSICFRGIFQDGQRQSIHVTCKRQ